MILGNGPLNWRSLIPAGAATEFGAWAPAISTAHPPWGHI